MRAVSSLTHTACDRYGIEDCLFFLCVRDELQSMFGIQLKLKEKLLEVDASRSRPPEQSVALAEHPVVHNGLQNAHLPPLSVKHILRKVLGPDEAKVNFVAERVLQEEYKPVEGFADKMV